MHYHRNKFFSPVIFAFAVGGAWGCGGGGGGSSAPVSASSPPPVGGASPPPTSEITEIRLLGLFTPSLETQFIDVDLRIQHLVNTANDVLDSNAINLRYRIDHLESVNYPDGFTAQEALTHITFEDHPSLIGIHALRDTESADLVVLFRPYANDGNCGFAWIGGYQKEGDFSAPEEADFGYSVVSANCSDYTLVHELGHNLGLAHSRREDPIGGSYAWGAGFGVDQLFATIMATASTFNAVQLPQFSSPVTMCQGQPCGVSSNDPDNGADAIKALKISKDQVAAYR